MYWIEYVANNFPVKSWKVVYNGYTKKRVGQNVYEVIDSTKFKRKC